MYYNNIGMNDTFAKIDGNVIFDPGVTTGPVEGDRTLW